VESRPPDAAAARLTRSAVLATVRAPDRYAPLLIKASQIVPIAGAVRIRTGAEGKARADCGPRFLLMHRERGPSVFLAPFARLAPAVRASNSSAFMTFETDSKECSEG